MRKLKQKQSNQFDKKGSGDMAKTVREDLLKLNCVVRINIEIHVNLVFKILYK